MMMKVEVRRSGAVDVVPAWYVLNPLLLLIAQIGTNWLLTAAHCLYEEKEQIPARSLAVLLGLHDRRKTTEELR